MEEGAEEGGVGATVKQGAQVGSSTAYTRGLFHTGESSLLCNSSRVAESSILFTISGKGAMKEVVD